ncbi:sinapoylglucose 1 [Artemisia annua]|uniref:Sinapoylglucose 1 n=1 Tax=Artemisia annua TaxID=35608 RepID=A0A2U1MLL3_ARTAN|nr:sinapoylglucose 1 [Artemisia annua]
MKLRVSEIDDGTKCVGVFDELGKDEVKSSETELKASVVVCDMFVKEEDEIEESEERIDLGRLVYGDVSMKVNTSKSVDSKSVDSEFMVMEVDEFQDCANLMNICLPYTKGKEVVKGKCNSLVENKYEYGIEQNLGKEDNDLILSDLVLGKYCDQRCFEGWADGYKSFYVATYASHVHSSFGKTFTCDDEWHKQEEGTEEVKMKMSDKEVAEKDEDNFAHLEFDIWKWPTRKKVAGAGENGPGLFGTFTGFVFGMEADLSGHIQPLWVIDSQDKLTDNGFKSTKENCHGEYLNVDPNNSLCVHDLDVVDKCLGRIRKPQILEPYCETTDTLTSDLYRRGLGDLDEASVDIWSLLPQVQTQWCRDDNYLYSSVWANSKDVREALHIREEFGETEWVRCNDSMHFYFDKEAISYTHNVNSVVSYHRNLSEKNCRALIYSGDHDMVVPYLSTMNLIESLNLPVIDDWRPWFVDKQVSGYTVKYSKYDYSLTFATVKGGGHTAPEYKPRECLSMLVRWLHKDTL